MVGMFLIEGTERAALIDTGAGMGDLLSEVKKLTNKPLIVLNTHAHMDHGGGNHQFAEVFMHENDFPLSYEMCNYDERVKYVKSRLGMFAPEKVPEALASLVPDKDYIRSPLHDGQLIDLGGRCLEVIFTPGHTPGSVCFLSRSDRVLFSGDTINPSGMLLQAEYRCTELPVYVESVRKLIHLDGYDVLLRCHGEPKGDPAEMAELADVVEGIAQGKYHGERIVNPMRNGWVFKKGKISVCYDEK